MGNGSSYIRLPNQIAKKHACVNVKNNDEACFAWAIVSSLFPADSHSDRVSSYPHYSEILNLKNIELPMSLPQITKFEKQNNISVNIYILRLFGNNFYSAPARLTKTKLEK